MSIAEFTSALKNKAIKEWFNKESGRTKQSRKDNINTLLNPTNVYRSSEEVAEKTSFIITRDTVRDLVISFSGITDPALVEEQTDIHFSAFAAKNVGAKVNRRRINIGNSKAVFFNSISFDTITSLVNNIMNLKTGELAKFYEKGHVVGLNTELLRVTSNRIYSEIDGRTAEGAKQSVNLLIDKLTKVIEYYKRLDYASANIQPYEDVKVYASVNKGVFKTGKTKYLVELQVKDINQKSAREVKDTMNIIRKIFDPGVASAKVASELIDKLIPRVSDKQFIEDLLDMKSSPSYNELLVNIIANTIAGKPINDTVVNHNGVEIFTKKVPKPDTTEFRKEVKNVIAEANKLKGKLNTTKPRKVERPKFSLSSLQALLNRHLQDVISANMGDGNSRTTLNYRTGRLAASAKVER